MTNIALLPIHTVAEAVSCACVCAFICACWHFAPIYIDIPLPRKLTQDSDALLRKLVMSRHGRQTVDRVSNRTYVSLNRG